MYSVSAEFLTAMNAPVQEHKVKGTIGSYTFGPGNILSGSFFVTNQCSENNMLGIGQVYVGELGATFRNVGISDGAWVGQIITPTFSLKTENGWEDVPLGVYTIAEATISASGVTVKAYDNMTLFDKALVGVIEDEYPYDVLSMACNACGVTLTTTRADIEAMANGTTKVTMSGTVETWRDVVAWMAQALGANATIDRSGYLRIFQYGSTSVATYDDTHRHSGASFADFVTRYTGISLTISATNTTYYYHDTPDDALTMELGANPFLQIGSDADRQQACEDILADLQAVQYSPFNVNLTGCPIYDLGDILTFEDGILSTQKTGCVTFFNYVNHAAYNIKGGGKNPAEASSKSRLDKVVGSLAQTVADQVNQMSVVQNAAAASIADGSEESVLVYNFEVTEDDNLTMLDVSIAMTSSASETEADDVYTLSDIVAHLSFYVDGSEVNVYAPEFIVDEGKDTMTFNYSLSGLSVGAHEFDIRMEMSGGSGSVAVGDVHEMLWGYGITFEVYVKGILVDTSNAPILFPGMTYNYNGVIVSAVYNNGLTSDVTGDCTFDPAQGTSITRDDIGQKTIDVEYEDFSDSFEMTVSDIALNMGGGNIPLVVLPDGTGRWFTSASLISIWNCYLDSDYAPHNTEIGTHTSSGNTLYGQELRIIVDGVWIAGQTSSPKGKRTYYDFATDTYALITPVVDFIGHPSASIWSSWGATPFVVDGYIINKRLKISYDEGGSTYTDVICYGVYDLNGQTLTLHIRIGDGELPLYLTTTGDTTFQTDGTYIVPVYDVPTFFRRDIDHYNEVKYVAKSDGSSITIAEISVDSSYEVSITDVWSVPFGYTPNLIRVNRDEDVVVIGYADASNVDVYIVNMTNLTYVHETSNDPANNDFYNHVVGQNVLYQKELGLYFHNDTSAYTFDQTYWMSEDLVHWNSISLTPTSGGGHVYKTGSQSVCPSPIGFWASGKTDTDSGVSATSFVICYALEE